MQNLNLAREYARKFARAGIGHLAHALNACADESRDYIYSIADIDRFKRIAVELVEIIEEGNIKLTQIEKAKSDKAFQSFMNSVTSK